MAGTTIEHKDANGTKVCWKDYVDIRLAAIENMLGTIRSYIDERVNAIKELIEDRFEAEEKATTLASETLSVRLELLNNLRTEVTRLGDNYLTKIEFQSFCNNYEDYKKRSDTDIRSLRESRAEVNGKASQEALNRTTIFAVVGMVIGIIGLCVGGTGLLITILTIIYKLQGI